MPPSTNNFLASPILPGVPVARHEHRRLVTVLAILVVIALISMAVLWMGAPKSATVVPVTSVSSQQKVSQAVVVLKAASANSKRPTQTQVQSAINKLSKVRTQTTAAQEARAIEQLKAARQAGAH